MKISRTCRFLWREHVPILLCSIFSLVSTVDSSEGILEKFTKQALSWNPALKAARQRLEEARQNRFDVAGFFDPQLVSAFGIAGENHGVPGSGRAVGITEDAVSGRVGVEIPLRLGAWLHLGFSQRYLFDPADSAYDDLNQSTVGLQLWIPMARGRKFADWQARDAWSEALLDAAASHVLFIEQVLRHDVERTYIEFLLTNTEVSVIRKAKARVSLLASEAEDLARLKVIPHYQVSPARMEVAFYEDEEAAARQSVMDRRLRLARLTGKVDEILQNSEIDDLLDLARIADSVEAPSTEPLWERRGLYLEVVGFRNAASALIDLAEEDLKPEIGLSLATTYQGEDDGGIWGSERHLSDTNFSGEVAVVWRRPWNFTSEKARYRARKANLMAWEHELEELRRIIVEEIELSRTAYMSARERIQLVTQAVFAAQNTLTSEEERFRLGEGRSRNVLDAQKDLTKAIRRQNAAASAMLLSRADLDYALGYPGILLALQGSTELPETSIPEEKTIENKEESS